MLTQLSYSLNIPHQDTRIASKSLREEYLVFFKAGILLMFNTMIAAP